MNNDYKLFLKECIKNRVYLEFSYKDMSNCLDNVSEEEYEEFEKGKGMLSLDNLRKIAKVLCIEKPIDKDLNKYIDADGLDEEELNDIAKVVNAIVGDDNA